MSEMALISIVSMVGWLLLMGSALVSYKLGWSKIIRMALIWLCIFVGMFLLVSLVRG